MMQNALLRLLALSNNFMVLAASAIVTGIVSFFLNRYSFRNVNVIFHEVIATITLGVYALSFALPLIRKYRGYLLPFNLIFSYLWLTCFIFSTQAWVGSRCSINGPTDGNCSLKKAVIAFDFVALFFLLTNAAAEILLWRATGKDLAAAQTKGGPLSDSPAAGTNNA